MHKGKQLMRTFTWALVLTFLVPPASAADEKSKYARGVENPGAYQDVSAINLVAHPEKYHKQPIRVYGILSSAHMEKWLYVHRDAFRFSTSRDLFALHFLGKDWKSPIDADKEFWEMAHGKMCFVEGTFYWALGAIIQPERIVVVERDEKE